MIEGMDTTDTGSTEGAAPAPTTRQLITRPILIPIDAAYETTDVTTKAEATALPWERQEGEPTRWYERFWSYVKLGPTRNVLRAYRDYRAKRKLSSGVGTVPTTWYRYLHDWRWYERAAAWDDHMAQIDQENVIKERLEARTERRKLIHDAGEKLDQAIESLPRLIDWRDAANAIKVVASESRIEYDDVPAARIENTVTLKLIEEVTAACIEAFIAANGLPTADERKAMFSERITAMYESTRIGRAKQA